MIKINSSIYWKTVLHMHKIVNPKMDKLHNAPVDLIY